MIQYHCITFPPHNPTVNNQCKKRGKQDHLSASAQGLRRAIRVLPVGGFLPVHLSHRLERGRSPVYCFGPGPYHLPGRQPNSTCRSADHLLPGSLLLHSSCRGLVAFVGEKKAHRPCTLGREERKSVASVEISRDSHW